MKASRLVKRRSLAKELCDEGAVVVNGRAAAAGRTIREGDELGLHLWNRKLVVTVLSVPARQPSAAKATELYRVETDERIEPSWDD